MSDNGKKEPKNLSIEQAGNYLKEKDKTMAEDVKKQTKDMAISFATPEDRHRFLMYGLSLLTDVSESAKNAFCAITNKTNALHSTREAAGMLRKLMVLRINGYSRENISHHLKESVPTIGKCEELAMKVMVELIQRAKGSGLPIIGG